MPGAGAGSGAGPGQSTEEQPPGSDLHLRGSLDLNKVGDATLKAKRVGRAGEEPAKAPEGR